MRATIQNFAFSDLITAIAKKKAKEEIERYLYNKEYPAFSIHILGDDLHLISKSLKSIDAQKYPFVHVSIISKTKYAIDFSYKNITSISFEDDFLESEITSYLSNASKKSSDFYFSIIPEGTEYLPQAFSQVRNIIKRFVEVHWLIGTPVYKSDLDVQLPIDIAKRRLNKEMYLQQISRNRFSNIDPASSFFTKSLLDSLPPTLSEREKLPSFDNLWRNLFEYADPYFSTFYSSYTKRRNLNISPKSISEWLFKNNIPYFRYFFRQKMNLNPVIRFEHRSNSYYFSEY